MAVSGSQSPTAPQHPLQPSSVYLWAWIPPSSPHDSFSKHFPGAHSGSQGLGGRGGEMRVSSPPLREGLSSSISGSLTLRFSIPRPTGQEGLGCLMPWKRGWKRPLLRGHQSQEASLHCPRMEGTQGQEGGNQEAPTTWKTEGTTWRWGEQGWEGGWSLCPLLCL